MHRSEPCSDFSWSEIEPEPKPSPRQEDRREILDQLLEWIYQPSSPKAAVHKPRVLSLRIVAMLYYLRPEWLGPNCTEAAAARSYRVSRARLNYHVQSFRRRFGFIRAGMRHRRQRINFARAQCRAHAIRKSACKIV